MDLEQSELAKLLPFVATQIRGALSSLHLAAAQLVPSARRELDPTLDLQAARMDQSYYRLLRLVDNLSMATYLADSAPLPLQDKDLVELVGNVCEEAAALALFPKLYVRFVCPMDRCICAVAPDAVKQILRHLLSNAFKFTPAGGEISVELRLLPGHVLIAVSDTGKGIPPERLSTLFDWYERMENRMDPPPHGLGLGLPLCRCLAERQGGTLLAESLQGKGSRFTLSLPLRQVGGSVSDVPIDYFGGFNPTLVALADALPAEAFLLRNQV